MKRFVKNVLAVLVVAVVIILIKDEFSPKLLKRAHYGMPALIEKGYVDNLYIGSSMFRQGIDIMVLEENDAENYILAYNGNQPMLEYFQLKNILNSGVTVKNLYVDMYVYSAWAKPKISDEKLLMEYGLTDKWAQWELLADDSSIENVKLFWQMFVTGNNELLLTWPLSSTAINSIFYKGGSVNKPVPSSKAELDGIGVPQISGEMNDIQKEYSEKLINLAKNNNINLIYIETPKYDSMVRDGGYVDAMRKYIDFLDGEDIDYILDDTTWKLTGEKECFAHYLYDNGNNEYYVDCGHLSYEGRIAFTRNIMSKVN